MIIVITKIQKYLRKCHVVNVIITKHSKKPIRVLKIYEIMMFIKLFAQFVKKEFSIKNIVNHVIDQHLKSKSHRKCVSLSENHKVNSFFTRKESSEGKFIEEV
ncbi:hypothetical protein C0J52_06541 [Blattella germanica]|nr:hypothetical protein C0J52_06541 [Blattella germanica]